MNRKASLNLIEYILILFRLNAKICQSLTLRRMAEYFHEFRQRVTKMGTLDITPSFSQGVATVITLQIDQAAPFFNQVMEIRNGRRPLWPMKR